MHLYLNWTQSFVINFFTLSPMNVCVSDWGFILWPRFFSTVTEEMPWLRFFRALFLSCKTNARVLLAKTGHGPHSYHCVVLCIGCVDCVVLYIARARARARAYVCVCVCVCVRIYVCVLYYCHRVSTLLQLTNISYYITQQNLHCVSQCLTLSFCPFLLTKYMPV